MNSMPGKVLDVFTTNTFNSFNSDASNDNEKIDNPNEYRDLLISLSGEKSDHVLWIECLKQYQWKSELDSEFSFELDKFGVPLLKNGNYKLNLCYDCLDVEFNARKNNKEEDTSAFDGFSFIWEGNYWDGYKTYTNDFAHLSAESIFIVVNKCANIIQQLFNESLTINDNATNKNKKLQTQNIAKGQRILVYMPNVVQFFIVQMAAARVGAILTFVNAAINKKIDDLAQILEISLAELVFTVDGFFIGEELQYTKQILDKDIHKIKKVVVVKHVGPNPHIPPPTVEMPKGRRPHYNLESPFTEGRDYHWSDLMLDANEECICEWMETEDIIFHTIKKIAIKSDNENSNISKQYDETSQNIWHFESYTVGQIALLVRLIGRTLQNWNEKIPNGPNPIWPLVEKNDLLFLSSLFAIPLAGFALLMCECPPTHPNPSRIYEIIEKYKVKQLLIAEYYVKLLIRNNNFHNVWYQKNDPMWDSSSLEMIYAALHTRPKIDSYADFFNKCIPTANFLPLFC